MPSPTALTLKGNDMYFFENFLLTENFVVVLNEKRN